MIVLFFVTVTKNTIKYKKIIFVSSQNDRTFFYDCQKKYDRIYKSNFCEHKNFNYVGSQYDRTFFDCQKKYDRQNNRTFF